MMVVSVPVRPVNRTRPFSCRALILQAMTPLRENRIWLRETRFLHLIKTHGHVSAAKKPCGTQVYYLQEPLTRHFKPLISQWSLSRFLSNSSILCLPYMLLYILNLKKIGPVVHKICVSENCPIFFTFF